MKAEVAAAYALPLLGITLALLALLVPMLATRPSQVGAAVAATLSLSLHRLPFKLGVVTAILAGIGAAVVAERKLGRRT